MRKILSRRCIPALLGACALTASVAAFAADQATDAGVAPSSDHAARRAEFQQRFFDKLDANKDGVVSRAEYQTWIDQRFAKLDAKGTGSVTAADIESSPAVAERVQKRADHFIKRYDTSGTGTVTQADFEAKEMARFDRMSGGADTLTAEQLAAASHRHGRRHAPQVDAAGNATPAGGG